MKSSFSIPAALKWMGAAAAAHWLAIPLTMRLLLLCMAADYVTGLGAAFVRRELSSGAAWLPVWFSLFA